MQIIDRDKDTICAVSTPPGYGGVSVLRVSGPRAIEFVRRLQNSLPATPESHKAYFGTLKSAIDQSPIDEVLTTVFHAGKSFTGEETCEISCHGSPIICHEILSSLLHLGCRAADRGEFTYRSFMNGKVDLVQAEAVLSMVNSQSPQAARQALRQIKGSISSKLAMIEDHLTWCLAHIEASIDFSTEGLEVTSQEQLLTKTQATLQIISQLMNGYKLGRGIKNGFKLVLIGEPNAGKSSVFNALLGEDRAIVTEIAGTTRDVIENSYHHQGFKFVLSDTAGLRQSADRIEQIGVQKSREAAHDADIVLAVFDLNQSLPNSVIEELRKSENQQIYILFNKMDLSEDSTKTREVLWEVFSAKFSEARRKSVLLIP